MNINPENKDALSGSLFTGSNSPPANRSTDAHGGSPTGYNGRGIAASKVESQSQGQAQNPSPNVVEAEIVDEEEYISSTHVVQSPVNNIFIFMNDSHLISRVSKRRNLLGGLVMTAFLGLLALGSLFQGLAPAVNVGETVNAGLAAAKNNDPNQARELFRNLQNSNGECEAKLGESLVTAVEQSKSSDEFYQLADKPLRVASEQGCIKLR
jgi:hypothetical protein